MESAKNQFKTTTTTCKALVALTPAGSVAFVSQCFDGKLSDRDIVQYSGTPIPHKFTIESVTFGEPCCYI